MKQSKKKIYVHDVYSEYMTPKNLQEHMLRVGALAQVISENWIGEKVDGVALVQSAVLHDIAKPINFDLARQAQFGMSRKDIANLERLQIRLRKSFGENEHDVTLDVCKEIGCSSKTVKLVDNLEWSYIPRLIESKDAESLILIYCDMRIGINGIVTLEERLNDLKKREAVDDYLEKEENGKRLEAIIAKNVSIDLHSITNEQINKRFHGLLQTSLN